MKTLILSAALALALAGNAFAAEKTGLSAPIIMLTGVIAKNVKVLKLTDEQQVVLKDWLRHAQRVQSPSRCNAG